MTPEQWQVQQAWEERRRQENMERTRDRAKLFALEVLRVLMSGKPLPPEFMDAAAVFVAEPADPTTHWRIDEQLRKFAEYRMDAVWRARGVIW